MRRTTLAAALALAACSCSRTDAPPAEGATPPGKAAAGKDDTRTAAQEADAELNGPRKDPCEQKARVYMLKVSQEQVKFLKWGPNDTAGKMMGCPVVRVKVAWPNGHESDYLVAVDYRPGECDDLPNRGGDDWVAYEYRAEREGLRRDRADQRAKGWPKGPRLYRP